MTTRFCPHCGSLLLLDEHAGMAGDEGGGLGEAAAVSTRGRRQDALEDEMEARQEATVFACPTCPFQWPVKRTIVHHLTAENTASLASKKKVDDVLGGDAAWENVDRTEARCPHCEDGHEAYFMQIQIRSADEPMTTFYKCVSCHHQWSDD